MIESLEYCSVYKEGHVTTVTIEQPEIMNALHRPAHEELTRVLDAFSVDSDAWVAVITGSGRRAFCPRSDLKYMAETGDGYTQGKGFAGLTGRRDLTKPVNGVTVGGGGLHRLTGQIPLKKEIHLLLTGRICMREEPLALGLVN